MPIPMSSSASRMPRPAMIQSGVARELMSPVMACPLSRPAALRRAARHFVERPPALVRRGARLLDRAADVVQFAHEVVELRFDLAADAPSVLRQVEPAPDTAGNRTEHGGGQYTGSFVHVVLLGPCARTHARSRRIVTRRVPDES